MGRYHMYASVLRHEETSFLPRRKTKTLISCAVTLFLLCKKVPSIFFLNPKFHVSVLLLLNRPVHVLPGQKPGRRFFSHCGSYMSRLMRKSTFCICKIKDADQLRGNHKADQRLCFRCMDSTIPLLSKSKFSSLQPSSGLVQLGLCQTCSETTLLVFPRDGSYI